MNTFTDPRDGEVYKTVKIGNQIWLAENLQYKGPTRKVNDWAIEEKNFYYPPNGDWKNIKQYGCLYTWDNAIKACPDGWHLPTKEEFEKLLDYVSKNNQTRSENLRATTWDDGLDTYGFGALPAGYYYGSGKYRLFCDSVVFWSSTEHDFDNAYLLNLDDGYAGMGYSSKDSAYSVRCIKD